MITVRPYFLKVKTVAVPTRFPTSSSSPSRPGFWPIPNALRGGISSVLLSLFASLLTIASIVVFKLLGRLPPYYSGTTTATDEQDVQLRLPDSAARGPNRQQLLRRNRSPLRNYPAGRPAGDLRNQPGSVKQHRCQSRLLISFL